MKRIATMAASALVALGMGLIATAASKTEKVQPAKDYVKVDKELFKKAAENIVKGAKDLKENDKSYFKDLFEKAFDEYTTGKAKEVEVYDKAAIDALNKEKKVWIDSAKNLCKRIEKLEKDTIDLRQKLKKENVQGQLDAINKKHKADSSALEDKINELKAENNRLRADSTSLANSNAELAKDAKIAEKVKIELGSRRGKVNDLYGRYSQDSVPKVDPKEVEKTLGDYEDYLKMIGIPLGQEQKDTLEQVRAVARVAKHYHDGIEILSKKYDAKAVQQWNAGVNSLTTSVARLKRGQKMVWQNVVNAFSTIDAANAHFKKNIIIDCLREQGQIPGNKEANEVKDMVKTKVGNFAKSREYKDTTKYHELHTHLNKVLKKMDDLKVMNEEQYKAFVDKLEKSL